MTNSDKNPDSDDEAVCFATMDFTGVNFDDDGTALDASTPFLPSNLDEILAMFGTDLSILDDKSIVPSSWITPAMKWILTGDYERVLATNIPSIMKFMKKDDQDDDDFKKIEEEGDKNLVCLAPDLSVNIPIKESCCCCLKVTGRGKSPRQEH